MKPHTIVKYHSQCPRGGLRALERNSYDVMKLVDADHQNVPLTNDVKVGKLHVYTPPHLHRILIHPPRRLNVSITLYKYVQSMIGIPVGFL